MESPYKNTQSTLAHSMLSSFSDVCLQTTELTRLQVGEGTGPANIIVSTIIEAENVAPLLLEYKAAGRAINVCPLSVA